MEEKVLILIDKSLLTISKFYGSLSIFDIEKELAFKIISNFNNTNIIFYQNINCIFDYLDNCNYLIIITHELYQLFDLSKLYNFHLKYFLFFIVGRRTIYNQNKQPHNIIIPDLLPTMIDNIAILFHNYKNTYVLWSIGYFENLNVDINNKTKWNELKIFDIKKIKNIDILEEKNECIICYNIDKPFILINKYINDIEDFLEKPYNYIDKNLICYTCANYFKEKGKNIYNEKCIGFIPLKNLSKHLKKYVKDINIEIIKKYINEFIYIHP